MPLVFTRFSSEAWSAIFIIFTTTTLINSKLPNPRQIFGIGLLLGTAFLFRYQSAFISIGLIAWLLYNKRLKLKDEVSRLVALQNELFPLKSLQERTINFSEFYLEYGDQLINELKENLDPLSHEFSILTL